MQTVKISPISGVSSGRLVTAQTRREMKGKIGRKLAFGTSLRRLHVMFGHLFIHGGGSNAARVRRLFVIFWLEVGLS